jgi:hypothetical protein
VYSDTSCSVRNAVRVIANTTTEWLLIDEAADPCGITANLAEYKTELHLDGSETVKHSLAAMFLGNMDSAGKA